MRDQLVKFYRQSAAGRTVLSIPRSIHKMLTNRFLSDEAWCRSMFLWSHGYGLDLDNPRTLNEKIQWLKLFNRKQSFAKWADKYGVRDCIKERFGERHLIPLLTVAEDPNKIDFSGLKEPFIIKPNHLSGKTIIVTDRKELNLARIRSECRRWLSTNLYREGREWQYKDIPPKILVEELLVDANGSVPLDYKFHCFQGKVALIQVDIDRQTKHRRNFYNVNWERLPFTWSVCAGESPLWPQGRDVEMPGVLSEAIQMTECLAEAFAYIRVDWYIVASKIYFGEVTFHHGGGYERILPFAWDRKLGEQLSLPVGLKPTGVLL